MPAPIGFVRPPRQPPITGPGTHPGGLARYPPPPPGFVRFRAVKRPDLGLVAELDGLVVPVDGTGVDLLTDRPGRVSITSEGGTPPLALRIPLLFDRWQQQASVEREIKTLERMLGVGGDRPKRPQLIVEGPGIQHAYERNSKLRWRISEPEWGDDIRYVNNRDRAFITVSVLARLVVLPDTLEEQVTVGKSGRVWFHATERLNTLRKVARYVRVPWRDLRKMNDRLPNDPDKRLKLGTRVRIA